MTRCRGAKEKNVSRRSRRSRQHDQSILLRPERREPMPMPNSNLVRLQSVTRSPPMTTTGDLHSTIGGLKSAPSFAMFKQARHPPPAKQLLTRPATFGGLISAPNAELERSMAVGHGIGAERAGTIRRQGERGHMSSVARDRGRLRCRPVGCSARSAREPRHTGPSRGRGPRGSLRDSGRPDK